MPSKEITSKLKAVVETVTESVIDEIILRWFNTTIPELNTESVAAAALSNTLLSTPSGNDAPESVIAALSKYRAFLQNLAVDIHTLRTGLVLRIPEMKHEDNMGVEIQSAVIEHLMKFEKNILIGNKDGDIILNVNYSCEYFSSRATIEEKLIGNEKDGPSKSTSLKQQLTMYDSDAASKLAFSYKNIHTCLLGIIGAYINNIKKILNPRNESNRMVH